MAEQHKTKKALGFGGEGAVRRPGRPFLPQQAKKVRVEVYVPRETAEWIEANGGSRFAASVLSDQQQAEMNGSDTQESL